MSEWISVGDRLPERNVFVTVRDRLFTRSDVNCNLKGYGAKREAGVRIGHITPSGDFRSEGVNGNCDITHWMPLPEPPKS